MLALLAVVGCTGDTTRPQGSPISEVKPAWVESVIPEPSAVATVPNTVEVNHAITATDEDVRLVIDGVDVTTYATFEAGKIQYEPSEGPVDLGTGTHTAEVQRVTRPVEGTDYRIIDSYTWEFRTA